jgi:hypothetical protein
MQFSPIFLYLKGRKGSSGYHALNNISNHYIGLRSVTSQADEHIAKESYFVSLGYLSPFTTASTRCPPILSVE